MHQVNMVSRLAIAVACAASMPIAAHASEAAVEDAAPTAPAEDSGEIVVTAQKRSESINKVPLSITAASGDQLRSAGITSTADLGKIVPGFQAIQSMIGAPVYYLRGVGFNDVAVSSRPAVTLYADEAPLPFSIMAVGQSFDLERVEVLKGPQGLLFGSNSTGGAVNYISAKPTDSFDAGLDASFGSYGNHVVSGYLSGPLSDGLKARIAVQHEGSGDWQFDYTNPSRTIGSKDIWSGRITLEAEPTDRLKIRLTGSGFIDRSDPQMPHFIGEDSAAAINAAFIAYPVAPRDNRAAGWNATGPLGVPLQKDNWQWQGILRADYELSDSLTFTSLTSYVRNRQEYAVDGDGTNVRVNGFGVEADLEAFSTEARISGTIGERLRVIAGGNIQRDSTSEINVYDSSGAAVGNAFSGPPFFLPPSDSAQAVADINFRSNAGFVNFEYDVSDQLTLRSGVRYTATKSSFLGCTESGFGPGGTSVATALAFIRGYSLSLVGPGLCLTAAPSSTGQILPVRVNDSLSEKNWSWRVGVDYKPSDSTLIYASVSRGYKAGAFSNFAAANAFSYEPAKQERITAYEAGVKTDIVPRILHVNAALYYYDYANKQVQGTVVVPPFGPNQKLVNIPESRIWGAEFEVILRPTDGLTLGGNLTYVNSKVTGSFVGATQFGPFAQFAGSQLPNTPEWQANANADYRFPISANLNGFVGANLTYRSRTNGDFLTDARLAIDPYTLVDARIGLESADGAWTVEAFGRNIFNTYYWNTAQRTGDGITRRTGAPAIFGARVSFRFN